MGSTEGNRYLHGGKAVNAGRDSTTALKKAILQRELEGKKIKIIDPDQEYRFLAEKLGGTVVILDPGAPSSRFNPLEAIPQETDNEKKE